MENNVHQYVESLCLAAKAAAPAAASASGNQKNEALRRIAGLLRERSTMIVAENMRDMDNAAANGIPGPMLDRLRLDEKRIAGIAESLFDLCRLEDPTGAGERIVRPNGLIIEKIRVPLGTIGIIYEARPNVTVDAAALCIKSGNACVLRGGKEAIYTNRALIACIKDALAGVGMNPDAAALIEDTSRESSVALMGMRGLIDVLIPRGSAGLIRAVVENASVPVIETGAGNCHLYVDESADLEMAVSVAVNAKTSRPSVCNAIETLLVHQKAATEFLPRFAEAVRPWSVELRGCERTRKLLPGIAAATEEDYRTEYDDYILAVKVVDDFDEAIAHINRYNTGHSEAIITRSLENARRFQREIDAAAVYVNASTRFTDGGEFGLGAEIGISTQKLHARGPMGLRELTTVKYLIDGDGQCR